MAEPNVIGNGEYRSTKEPRVALISGNKFRNQPFQFSAIEDMAIFEGDIVLGTVEQVVRATKAAESGAEDLGIGVKGHRWPEATVPYTIDPGLPKQERVRDAIQHWQDKTKLRLVPRTNQGDYVVFRNSPDGCSSSVGKQGGVQYVNLGAACSTGNAIHEIGHTVGLWHEQSRSDRDQYITIAWTNIIPNTQHNFLQHISDGDDIGTYDYASIMHYSANAFALDSSKPTIITKNGSPIGQRVGLSPEDIAAANSLYK
jgi:Astacin (Peptidase family M12A)